MLSVVAALPATFGLVIWYSYRTETARAARGEAVGEPGALRWRPGEEAGE
jgi:hypothetical protein